ncbi:MAG: hypothetical protein AAF353_18815, partial [Pseudomonadota bacterium]
MSLRALYEDNLGLDTRDEIETSGLSAQASLKAGWRTELADFNIVTGAVRREYDEDSDRNATDLSIAASATRTGDLNDTGLQLELDHDSTLTSELQTTGFVDEQISRRRKAISPFWQYRFNERSSVRFTLGHQVVNYEDAENTSLVDYDYDTANVSINFRVTEVLLLLGQLDAYVFDPDSSQSRTRASGILSGFEYSFSEITSLTFQLGTREARVGGESDRDHQASVNLQHQLETGTLEFGFRSFLTPGGSGELLQTRTSSLSWDQSLSARWSSQSEIEEIRNDGSDLLTTSRGDRRYRRFLQRFRYRIDREWSFDVA